MSDREVPRGDEPVGSVGEEAVKLFAALTESFSGWTSDSAGLAAQLDDHLATGAPECRWCPVCRTIHAVRSAGPEVRVQLTTAAASLMQAAAGLLAAAAEPPATSPASPTRPTRPGSVQRIDLDDDQSDDQSEEDR